MQAAVSKLGLSIKSMGGKISKIKGFNTIEIIGKIKLDLLINLWDK